MCNSRGDSETTTPSVEFTFKEAGPASVTGGDAVGIKSWTSTKTGGGEGCLIISI